MNNLNNIEELFQPSFFQRLLKKKPQDNAFIEINNLLLTKPLEEINAEEITAISIKYKVDLRKRFIAKLKELYLRYLTLCLSDNILSNQDVVFLNHLKDVLMLNDSEVEDLHSQVAGGIYKKSYDEVISDGNIDKSEEEFLEKLKENLRLPTIVVEKISNESKQALMQMKFNEIVADGKISPTKWEELTTLAKNLDDTVTLDEKTKAKVEKLKLHWLIENGELPVKEVPINLQKDERCYFTSSSDWLEHRTVTKRINYGGPTARIKIMKGIYYRAGSMGVQRITSEELQIIDSGQLYITNKRIIFVGNKKNSNIQFGKILSINPYSDGVGIEKDSGKSPIFRLSNNSDILAMTLSRLINDFHIT